MINKLLGCVAAKTFHSCPPQVFLDLNHKWITGFKFIHYAELIMFSCFSSVISNSFTREKFRLVCNLMEKLQNLQRTSNSKRCCGVTSCLSKEAHDSFHPFCWSRSYDRKDLPSGRELAKICALALVIETSLWNMLSSQKYGQAKKHNVTRCYKLL